MLFVFLLFLHWAEPLACWIEEVRKTAGLVILSPLSVRLATGLHGCDLLIIILRKWHLMSSLLILFPFLIKNIGFCQILYLHLLRSLYGFLWKSVGIQERHVFFTIFVLNFIFFCSHFIYFLLLLICSSVCSFCHTPWFWAQYTPLL